MMKGPIYSRRVKKGGETLPAATRCQLSDQGEYPLGLLCCDQDSGTRGAPLFAHAGELVLQLPVCPRLCRMSTWRPINGDTCCPFCLEEHLRCHLDVFQKLLDSLADISVMSDEEDGVIPTMCIWN
ncbi:hypothetical protein HanHA89_Chr05g0204181 [Helianthus annuus]|nr:hypothetical protein HanHA89_Chr05g0204181 [Helianthus annuus]